MKYLTKLKVPTKLIQPKLFIVILKCNDGKQCIFEKVDYNLEGDINQCYLNVQRHFDITSYVRHTEISVDRINDLFKQFRG